MARITEEEKDSLVFQLGSFITALQIGDIVTLSVKFVDTEVKKGVVIKNDRVDTEMTVLRDGKKLKIRRATGTRWNEKYIFHGKVLLEAVDIINGNSGILASNLQLNIIKMQGQTACYVVGRKYYLVSDCKKEGLK